jgi:hypothetical protein
MQTKLNGSTRGVEDDLRYHDVVGTREITIEK